MNEQNKQTQTLYLMLQANGYVVLDKDYVDSECDSPPLDPNIKMSPVSVQTLVKFCAQRNLDSPEPEDAERLRGLLRQLKASTKTVKEAIKKIERDCPH